MGEDAAEWKPDRWLSPLPSSVTDARVPAFTPIREHALLLYVNDN